MPNEEVLTYADVLIGLAGGLHDLEKLSLMLIKNQEPSTLVSSEHLGMIKEVFQKTITDTMAIKTPQERITRLLEFIEIATNKKD